MNTVQVALGYHRLVNKVRRLVGLEAHEPFTFCGRVYSGNRFAKVPDPSDMPPSDVAHLEWEQDMMVVPRRDAERHLREREAWVGLAKARLIR